jgi:hypothetical protein
VGADGTVLRTTDRGYSWEMQTCPSAEDLHAVTFTDGLTGTIVGNSGVILRTTSGGVTWIGEQPHAPKDIVLAQNYPNPFNPSTTIEFTLPQAERVTLIVTDLYGREIRRLLHGDFREAGIHQVNFNASDLPSGVYLYALSVGVRRTTRTMVLLR